MRASTTQHDLNHVLIKFVAVGPTHQVLWVGAVKFDCLNLSCLQRIPRQQAPE